MKPLVIVISGATPYLGGTETWRPLRQAAADIHFVEIDPLDFVDATDLDAALDQRMREHVSNVSAVVAHFNADRAVVEFILRERPDVPIVLLSPCTVFSKRSRLQLVSMLISFPGAKPLLTALAAARLRRLRASREHVIRSLSSFVGASSRSEPLIEEACVRVRDDRTARAVARTPDLLDVMLRPLQAMPAGATLTVVLGSSNLDLRTAHRTNATVVPGVVAAAMIEAPATVATIVREAIERARYA